MINQFKKRVLVAATVTNSVLVSSAVLMATNVSYAGGFDYSDQSVDLLLKPGNVFEIGYKYVKPERRFANVRRVGITQTAAESENFPKDLHVPHFQIKRSVSKNVDCLFAYRQPFGTDQDHGAAWEGRYYATATDLDVQSLGLDCAYARQLSEHSRILYIGGLRIERAEALIASQVSSAAVTRGVNLTGPDSAAVNELDSTEPGFTLGFAYQIPKKGVSLSVVYNSETDHSYTGTQTVTVPAGVVGAAGTVLETPISLNVKNPQTLHINASVGIKPGWLALGFARWVDWSSFVDISIRNERTGAISSGDVGWQDTWTVGGGVAHRFNKTTSAYAVTFFDEDASSDEVRGARTSVADGVGLTLGLTTALSKKNYLKASFTVKHLTDTQTLGYAPTQTNGVSDPLAGEAFTATTASSNVYVLKLITGWKF